ncbi:MAG: SDR family NAD(P)-dependent oxidoreductase [Chloroflexota bacterium]
MKEKVVFITGASSGIGKEVAIRFAKEGARLILTYHKREKEGLDTVQHCRAVGASNVILIKLDVERDIDIAAARDRVAVEYGAIDILINNAGTAVVKRLKDHTLSDIKGQVRTNLEGLIKVTRVFMPLVRDMIINVGSALAKKARGNHAVYCATKFGVRGFTQALAQELPHLRICCLNPDLTATALTGYQGRSPQTVAEISYKVATGIIPCEPGGDVDVWEVAS